MRTDAQLLRENAFTGLKKLGYYNQKEYRERLEYELEVIISLGFEAYFLIMEDVMKWALNNMICSPARGCLSAEADVFVENGRTKQLSNIKRGDYVISHSGEKRAVTNTFKYEVNETLLKIKTYYGYSDGIVLTKDHKVFGEVVYPTFNLLKAKSLTSCRERKYTCPSGSIKEIEAQKLTINDYIFFPKPKRTIIDFKNYDLVKFIENNKYDCFLDNEFIIENVPSNKKFQCSNRDLFRKTGKTRNAIKTYINNKIYGHNKPQQIRTIEVLEKEILKNYETIEHWKNEYKKLLIKKVYVPSLLKIDNDFLWILGNWVADGWLRSNNIRTIGFCCGNNKLKNFEKILSWIKKTTNSYCIAPHKTKNVTQITISSGILFSLWKELFPNYKFKSKTKHVPDFIFSLSEDKILKFLDGYLSGDGFYSKGRLKATTASPILATQLKFLFSILNAPCSITKTKRKEKREEFKNSGIHYVLNVPLIGKLALLSSENKTKASNRYHVFHNGILCQIKSIEEIDNIKEVYDISVEKDRSYLTTSGAVHNSAGGSLLCYCLEITRVNPLKHGLMFERFLNPARGELIDVGAISDSLSQNYTKKDTELNIPDLLVKDRVTKELIEKLQDEEKQIKLKGREFIGQLVASKREDLVVDNTINSWVLYCTGVSNQKPVGPLKKSHGSPPDIDSDFADRDAVFEYVKQRFGEEYVAKVGTWGLLKTKSAIRDVCRILNEPIAYADSLAKLVPPPRHGLWVSFEDDVEAAPGLLDPKHHKVMKYVGKVCGLLRSYGTHAGGVVISPYPINTVVPLCKDKEGNAVTQFDHRTLEDIGLLKFDFLGLSTLNIIGETLKLLKKRNIELDIYSLEDGDQETYDLINSGNLDGIFQLCDSGAPITQAFKPQSIDDIAIVSAINRPGPTESGVTTRLLAKRNGQMPIEYLHPALEPILKETYGEPIYQEQIMKLFTNLAGYSAAAAEGMRKVMGKKKPEEMEKHHALFLKGCKENGIEEHIAKEIFKNVENSASYLFNACLTGNTDVLLDEDNKVNLLDIKQQLAQGEKIELLSYIPTENKIVKDECLEVIDNGEQEVFELTLEDGSKIECTMNHKFVCSDGQKYELSEIIDKNLEILSL